MGQFVIVLSGMGNHGCSREVKSGEHVLGCQRPDCVDCIAREVVRRLKRNGVSELRGELVHWPSAIPLADDGAADLAAIDEGLDVHVAARYALVTPGASTVHDDLVSGVRTGSF